MTRDRQGKQSALDHGLPETAGHEVDEAVSAARKAFDDMALERPLPPYAEWSRDLIVEAQGNPIDYVEMFSGPSLEYSWLAKVTRDPTPQGLDGGRVHSFDLVRIIDRRPPEASDLVHPDEHQLVLDRWTPRDILMARYKSGKLSRFDRSEDRPATDEIIAEIKETCARWQSNRAADTRSAEEVLSAARDALFNLDLEYGLSPEGEKAHDLCAAALERIARTQDESHDRNGVLDSGKESPMEKDDAVARAIERVKQKEDEERRADDRSHSREQGKE